MSIKTDSTPVEDPKDPDSCTVYQLYCLMASDAEKAEMAENYRRGGYGYGHAKLALLDKINEYFGPIRERYAHYEQHPEEVEAVLSAGAKTARAVVREVTDRARAACGVG